MSVEFSKSETRLDLMRAFAGESQARNRYTIAAEKAREQGLVVLERVFAFTADQERAHAKVFYDHLAPLSGQSLTVDGGYPVESFPEVRDYLRAAQHDEYEEYGDVYPAFARVAEEEGFLGIAGSFRMIAAIEKTHGDRFGLFADLMERDKLFREEKKVKWMCLNCGEIVEMEAAPMLCPVCRHERGYFIRLDMAPYVGGKLI